MSAIEKWILCKWNVDNEEVIVATYPCEDLEHMLLRAFMIHRMEIGFNYTIYENDQNGHGWTVAAFLKEYL